MWLSVQFLGEVNLANWPELHGHPSLNWLLGKDPGKVKATLLFYRRLIYRIIGDRTICPIGQQGAVLTFYSDDNVLL